MRTLTYLVASTIDGYITGPGNTNPDFLLLDGDHVAPLREEYPEMYPTHARSPLGLDEVPNRHFDTVLQGRGSYEIGLREGITNAYRHLRSIVFSTTITSPDPTVKVVHTDPVAKVRELKRQDGMGSWLCGGGELATTLRDEIDELIIQLNPVAAGDGIGLFDGAGFAPERYDLVRSTARNSGVVVLTYPQARRVSTPARSRPGPVSTVAGALIRK
ncbi:dihydrofolate reductase [Saccharomonospora amisosensis]|uniref:Dihydrofolate reductase n=1 Tax=Saccharomonospora amisosensis TaxID=1128677 RepID=A0A7X5UPN8_9PSEU|nr:dihydrofolate reductase family protein [Saccharomonospora amisosensis]NIJ11836.1 dihydrofolate reductase [Saccharomonospora amisosensis]